MQSERIIYPNAKGLYTSRYSPHFSSIQDPTSESEIDLDRPCTSLSSILGVEARADR
jgi:hypothetical protein